MKFRIFLLCSLFAILFAAQNTIHYSLDDFDFSALGLGSIQGLFNQKPLNDPTATKVNMNKYQLKFLIDHHKCFELL